MRKMMRGTDGNYRNRADDNEYEDDNSEDEDGEENIDDKKR